MFNPVRYYQKRLEIKRNVFDADRNTLNLQELNRFVNGSSKKPRTAPTYLRAKTRDLLANTLVEDMNHRKFGGQLQQVADNLLNWCRSPGGAENKKVREWLKQLTEAKPAGRPAVESVEVESVEVESVEVEPVEVEPVEVESVKIPTWTFAQLIKDFGGDVQSGVSSKDVAPSHRTSEEEFDWSAACHDAMNGIEFPIPNQAEPGTEDVSGSNEENAPIDGVSERESDTNDMFERVDKRIENQRRRPAPILRPRQDSTQPRDHRVMHLLDNGQIAPVKQ
ncbi:hypothetical protein [uncultured Hydrogenophaga sp.]|uniref:hypothetical protein n=1 Tax=uncultured Hydrogenophaga sp. TaxID=199683 RepID=UPI0025840E3C|nr:hypothetical protein [uncultured Hydrogenophaga sp.]